jgi:bifunctional DNase/RNase
MAIQMKVKVLTYDRKSNMFALVLSDLEEVHAFPIWIGPFEANAIMLKLKKTRVPRPMTHDLIRDILEAFNSEVLKIEVIDLKGKTYYALIHVMADGKEITIDSRPSDAIAVALTAGAPIYVTEEVLAKTEAIKLDKEAQGDLLKEFLESLNPEDFKHKA